MHSNYPHIGIDEAGRGPLAGPVAVGVVMVPHDFDWDLIPGVNDSKKLSEKQRERIFAIAEGLQKDKVIFGAVTLVSAKTIDRIGISQAVMQGIERGLQQLNPDPEKVVVKLDGLLHAPEPFIHQQTIIKGDQKEKVIGLASILAKVTRDRYMVRLGTKYPEYSFPVHKGYGTKGHRSTIARLGLSSVHRVTFCRNIKIMV